METQPESSHARWWTSGEISNVFTSRYLQFNDAVSHSFLGLEMESVVLT